MFFIFLHSWRPFEFSESLPPTELARPRTDHEARLQSLRDRTSQVALEQTYFLERHSL
jgi:hypothetical protein